MLAVFAYYLSFRVELALLRSELFFEAFYLARRIGENILHFSLMVGVDFVQLELKQITSKGRCRHTMGDGTKAMGDS